MTNDEVIGSIRFSFTSLLKPWDGDPTQYACRAEGGIVASVELPDDGEGHEAAGRIELTIVRFTEALNADVDISDVFQEARLGAVYEAMFDSEGHLKKHLKVEFLPGEVIFIDAIHIEPKYESSPLLLQAVETAIASLSSMGLIVARRETLDQGNSKWKILGFDRVPRTRFVYRDNYGVEPRRQAY